MPKTLPKSIQTIETKHEVKLTNGSVSSSAKTRILLALWTLESATRSELKSSLVRRREKETVAEYENRSLLCLSIIAQLEQQGALTTIDNKLALSEKGLELLDQGLLDRTFAFEAQIGAKTANAFLRWVQQRAVGAKSSSSEKAADEIKSYEAFRAIAQETFDRLNQDFNLGNLVPIYRIRRELGERVSRSQFSEWLFAMQSEDLLHLLEEGVEDNAPDKIQDSVTTKLGKLRCYAKRPA